MCDCFNMACHGNTNALQLHIKVNSENLLPVPKKINSSALRIPADPSWPKIPPRKLTSDASEIVEQPCVVALTETQRYCTLAQTQLHSVNPLQDTKYSHSHQKPTSSIYTLKKCPDYVDPRFKKITSMRDSASLNDSMEEDRGPLKEINRVTPPVTISRPDETGKTIPERDTNTQQVTTQEAEKPDETRKVADANAQIDSSIQKKSGSNSNWQEKSTAKSNRTDVVCEDTSCKNETPEQKESASKSSSYQHVLKLTSSMTNAKTEVPSVSTQENGAPLLFMLDSNAQTHSASADYLKQCYTVQVPVLTYQNVPVQITSDGRVDMVERCLNNTKQLDIHHTDNSTAINNSLSQSCRNSIPGQVPDCTCKVLATDTRNKVIQEKDNLANQPIDIANAVATDKKEEGEHDLLKDCNVNHSNRTKRLDVKTKQDSSDSEYYVTKTVKKNARNLRRSKLRKTMCDTTGEDTSDTEIILQKNSAKQNPNDTIGKLIKKGKRITSSTSNLLSLTKSCSRIDSALIPRKNESVKRANRERSVKKWKQHGSESKSKHKSEQYLPYVNTECTRKFLHSSEPYIAFKRKGLKSKLSRKARTYFQKNSRLTVPGACYNAKSLNTHGDKCKHRVTKNGHYSINNLLEDGPNFLKNNEEGDPALECDKNELNNNSQSRLKVDDTEQNYEPESSARTNTEITVEKSTNIPLKTQELLNKSYWEYYNKLKHKFDKTTVGYEPCLNRLTAPEIIKQKMNKTCERDKPKLNSQIQTLEQCSALSTMINKALDSTLLSDIMRTEELYVDGNTTALSDPTMNRQGTLEGITACELSCGDRGSSPLLNSRAREKQDGDRNRQFLEVKTIVFFGSMLYILIIFLPMLYDYLYYEEYSEYENLSYPELLLEYVFSSFKEAFGSFFGGLNKILFQPVRISENI